MKGTFGSCQYIQYRKSRNKIFFFVQTRRLNSTMRNLMKYKYIFYLCCIFLSGCNKAPVKESEILWDTYGVPHIFADNYEDIFEQKFIKSKTLKGEVCGGCASPGGWLGHFWVPWFFKFSIIVPSSQHVI